MKELTRENLAVGDGHEIHVRSYGNPGGIPALFLHGGPGSGVQESQLGIFDPSRFHVIAFDQRGAGLSRFDDRFHANTTPHLVADIERIRKRFGIERWMVVGGSWGATLALAYATAHADRVGAMVLRAVFLGTHHELERAFLSSLPRFYPQLYADFVGLLPEDDRSRVLDAYWDRILDADPAVHRPFSIAWHDTERVLSVLSPDVPCLSEDLSARGDRPLPRTPFMEAHYFRNDCFLDAPLIEQVHRLNGLPGILIQGRYDLLCPPETSYALASRWTGSSVRVVSPAGHSMEDKSIRSALTAAITEMARLMNGRL